MHQQLSLFGSIGHAEIKICLHTMVALSGMSPLRTREHCIMWKPRNQFKPVLAAGEVNQIEQYRIMTSTEVNDIKPFQRYAHSAESIANREWKLTISEIPEAGKQKTTSQSIFESKVVDGNAFEFMKTLGYVYSFEYWQTGFTFVLGDVVVKIFHICVLPDKPESEIEDESLQLLDPSGKWIVKAYVNVQQLTDLKGLSNANSQLEKLQNELASLVTLRVPDRLAFDTRITARQR